MLGAVVSVLATRMNVRVNVPAGNLGVQERSVGPVPRRSAVGIPESGYAMRVNGGIAWVVDPFCSSLDTKSDIGVHDCS